MGDGGTWHLMGDCECWHVSVLFVGAVHNVYGGTQILRSRYFHVVDEQKIKQRRGEWLAEGGAHDYECKAIQPLASRCPGFSLAGLRFTKMTPADCGRICVATTKRKGMPDGASRGAYWCNLGGAALYPKYLDRLQSSCVHSNFVVYTLRTPALLVSLSL